MSGLRASFGSMGKPFNAGKAASDGLLAALLAAEGFSGAPRVLDPEGGLAAVFGPHYDGARVTEGLGGAFHLGDVSLKPYASCLASHAAIDVVLKLRAELAPAAGAVEALELDVSPLCTVIAADPKPRSALAAKFSVSFCAALALLEGRVAEDLFTDERVFDAAVRELMAKTTLRADPGLGESEARARIRLATGACASALVSAPKGDPRNPLRADEVAEKFRTLAAPVLPPGRLEEVLGLCAHVEELDHVGRFTAACRGV